MGNIPQDSFEKAITQALQINNLQGLSSDAEFLSRLYRDLSSTRQREIPFYQTWFKGVCNGLVASAIGLVFLSALNILPPFLVNASLNGAGIIREKIVQVTLEQHLLWQQMIINVNKPTIKGGTINGRLP